MVLSSLVTALWFNLLSLSLLLISSVTRQSLSWYNFVVIVNWKVLMCSRLTLELFFDLASISNWWISSYYFIDLRGGGKVSWCSRYMSWDIILCSRVICRIFDMYFCCPLVLWGLNFQSEGAFEGICLDPKAGEFNPYEYIIGSYTLM